MPSELMKKPRLMLKKIRVRGDEVAAVFFSIIGLICLVFSGFRFLAVGKFIDDFCFTFCFGWTKYLVYLLLLIYLIPIFFNCYFKFSFRFSLVIIFSLLLFSWTLQTVVLAIQQPNIWFNYQSLKIHNLDVYFHQWWSTTIINQYHGFFSSPLMFDQWNLNGFFPPLLVGGIISNAIIAILSYGYFILNVIINGCTLIIMICCIFKFDWFSYLAGWFSPKAKLKAKPVKFKNKKVNVHETLNYDEQSIATEIIEPNIVQNQFETNNKVDESPLKTTVPPQNTMSSDSKIHSSSTTNSNSQSQPSQFTSSGHLTPFGFSNPEIEEKSWPANQQVDLPIDCSKEQAEEPVTFTLFDDRMIDETNKSKTEMKE